MKNAFYGAGIFFFIFAGAMIAGIHVTLGKIETHLEKLNESEEK